MLRPLRIAALPAVFVGVQVSLHIWPNHMQELRCERAQGYLFAWPQAADEIRLHEIRLHEISPITA